MLYLFEYDFAHLSSFHAIHSISEIINIFIFSVIQNLICSLVGLVFIEIVFV